MILLCLFETLQYHTASNIDLNDCPKLCGDAECIEEWKNSANKITINEKSKNFSCVTAFLQTNSWGNDSFYDIYFQTIVPVPNCDPNSTKGIIRVMDFRVPR